MLGRNVRFFNFRKIHFGKFVKIDTNVFISALGKEGIFIGDNSSIGAFSRVIISTTLNNTGAFIRIGNNVGIGEFAYLGGAGGLQIGDNCIVGQYFSCHPENHNYASTDDLIRNQGVNRKGIKIGADCWIGSKVTILDGVIIGEGCVIAAGAVVTRSMPAYSVVGGVPAKVLKSRNELERHRNILTLKKAIA
ncbi:MAG: acyltransferase [Chitinophagales bacterium]